MGFEGNLSYEGWNYDQFYSMTYQQNRNAHIDDGWRHTIEHAVSREMGPLYLEVNNEINLGFQHADSPETKPASTRNNRFEAIAKYEIGPISLTN